jgi:hypothetical protein
VNTKRVRSGTRVPREVLEREGPLTVEREQTQTDDLKEEEAMDQEKNEELATSQASNKAIEGFAEAAGRSPAQAAMLAGSGNVDKIRDILFGNQMRDYEKRFVRLEERMLKEVSNLKDELKKGFDSLETYVKKELEILSDRQKMEQDDRTAAIQEVSRDLKETATGMEKKISNTEDQLNKRARDLHDQILMQSKTLSEEVQKKHEAITSALEREARELQNDKVDRSSLGELLMEMALRLTNEAGLDLVKRGLIDE